MADIPFAEYNTIKFTSTPLAAENTIRWTYGSSDDSNIGGEPRSSTSARGVAPKIVASTWITDVTDGTIRWLDALLVAASVEMDSSLMILLKTSSLTYLHGETKRTAYKVRALMAMRMEEQTVATMPKCRAWDGTIKYGYQEPSDEDLAEEVVQRSLVSKHAYVHRDQRGRVLVPETPLDDQMTDTSIHIRLMSIEQFLREM